MRKYIYYGDHLFLPKKFARAELDEKTNPVLSEISLDFLQKFDQYYEKGLAPVFLGPPGIGKTHCAAFIARSLDEHKIPTKWYSTTTLISRLLDLRDFRDKKYFVTRNDTEKIPVLVLDDFGQLQQYDRVRELFFNIVNIRYENNLPTIFTGNFSNLDGVEKDFGSALTRRIKMMSEGLRFVDKPAKEDA